MLAKFNADKLRTARIKRKMTQELLAERCNTTDRYIRDLESGRKDMPSAALVCQFSLALDVPMEALMDIIQEKEHIYDSQRAKTF